MRPIQQGEQPQYVWVQGPEQLQKDPVTGKEERRRPKPKRIRVLSHVKNGIVDLDDGVFVLRERARKAGWTLLGDDGKPRARVDSAVEARLRQLEEENSRLRQLAGGSANSDPDGIEGDDDDFEEDDEDGDA